jgi:hypothetical protein
MTQSPPPDQGWSDRPTTTDTTDTAPPASTQWSGPGTTANAVVVERPGRVTAASIILIVLGALSVLFGLLALLGGALFAGAASDPSVQAEIPGLPAAFAGIILVVAVILLAWGILEILSGAKALGGRNWARITGIVLSVIGLLLFVLGLLGSMGAPQTGVEGAEAAGPTSMIINVVIAAAYAFVIWAFATSGRWFASRSG